MRVSADTIITEWGTCEPHELIRIVRPPPPRRIESGGAYVCAVRSVARSVGDDEIVSEDGRIVAALWRAAPAAPSRLDLIREWLAYWHATQPRSGRPGSPYNDEPEDAVIAWRVGVPAERYPLRFAHVLRRGAGRARQDAAWRLSRRNRGCSLEYDVRAATAALRTVELARLARLPGWAVRVVLSANASEWVRGRNVNWSAVAALLADVRPWIERLRDERRPANVWLAHARQASHSGWRRGQWYWHGGCEVAAPPGVEWLRDEDGHVLAPISRLADVRPWTRGERGGKLREAILDAHGAFRARVTMAIACDWSTGAREADARESGVRSDHRHAIAAAWDTAVEKAPFAPYRDPADGSLVGWRAWKVAEHTLVSPHQGDVWHGPYLRAEALASGAAVRNEAGIHACWTRADVLAQWDSHAIGQVRGYGRAVWGREGWRAEECVILSLEVNPWVDTDRMAARYGVPVRRRV
jgi:hypothetical protein